MSKALIAWQLGGNSGHIAQDLLVAQRLRQLGHQVTFCVRDPKIAAERLLPAGFSFLPAPVAPGLLALGHPPGNYSEILLETGFADRFALLGQLHGWWSLFEMIQPEVVVIDHAPMALLAARAVNLPAVQLCNGFFLPPRGHPLPSIRPWEPVPEARLRHSDKTVLLRINEILARHGKPELEQVADLFHDAPALLTTFPELDHYGARADAHYIGPILDVPAAAPVHWATATRRRIVAYLRPSVGGLDRLFAALSTMDAEVVCAIPGATSAFCRHFASPSLRIFPHAVPLKPLLEGANLVISYGGPGTIAAALLAGLPLLLVPHMVEHYLCCLQVQELGAGVLVPLPRSLQQFESALGQILTGTQYADRARTFARDHRHFDSQQPIDAAATAITHAARV